jgi:hypothetical protein
MTRANEGNAVRLTRISAVVALAAGAFASPVLAIDYHWNSPNADWGVTTNWNPNGLPGTGDRVFVDFIGSGNPGIANVSTDTLPNPDSVRILNANKVQVKTFGSLGVSGDLIVGADRSSGSLTLLNTNPQLGFSGRVAVGDALRIGANGGVGTISQNDGTVTVNGIVRIADSNDPGATTSFAAGTYNLGGFGVLNTARLEIGYGGDTGQDPVMRGTLNLSGNAKLIVNAGTQSADVRIGGGNSVGILNQTGGTFRSQSSIIDMAAGGNGGSGAVYNYSGGVAEIAGFRFSTASSGTINFLAGSDLSLGQVSMTGGGCIQLAAGHDKTVRASTLLVSSNSAFIDLKDNSMVVGAVLEVQNGQSLRTLLSRGFNHGAWTGGGIFSNNARLNPQHNTGLGYARASEVLQPEGGTYQYHNQTVAPTDLIIEYTYYGDSDLNGKVNFDDYVRIDNGFNNHLTGWFNGDFNYDGKVNFDDYVLIDLAFNTQSGTLGRALSFLDGSARSADAMDDAALRAVQQHFDQFGDSYAQHFAAAVPEPASAIACAFAGLTMLPRRSRKRS